MTFATPWALAGALVLPALVWWYLRLRSEQERREEALARTGLVPITPSARRAGPSHVTPILVLLALIALLVGTAGPKATITEARREGVVILAFDVSNSMRADDVTPSRLAAAQQAARGFVEKQPGSVRIGVVAFSDTGVVTQMPTDQPADVIAAIDRLSTRGGTSLGQGIYASLQGISGGTLKLTEEQLAGDLDRLDIGYFGAAAVVLLSDGENTVGPDPLAVARLASVAGVKIETVGLGSASGKAVTIDGVSQTTRLDEATLGQIADTSDGTYHRADDAAGLASIYSSIDLHLTSRREPTEITSYFTVVGLALLLGGALAAVLRTGRVLAT